LELNKFLKSAFIKDSIILTIGTVISYIIIFFSLGFVTKYYEPSTFGEYSLIVGVIASINIISLGRLEPGIIRYTDIEESKILTYITDRVLLYMSLASLIIISILYSINLVEVIYFVIPISVFLLGKISIYKTWLNKDKKYKVMSINSIYFYSVKSIFEVGLGFFSFTNLGLYISYFVSNFVSLFHLKKHLATIKSKSSKLTRKRIFSENKNLVKYGLPNVISDSVRSVIILYLIKYFFDEEKVGYYVFSIRILSIPIGILSSNIGKVFYEKISSDKNHLLRNSYKMIKYLSILSFLAFVLSFLLLEPILKIFINKNFYSSIDISLRLLPWYCVSLVASPLTYILISIHKEGLALISSVLYSLIAISTVLVFNSDFDKFIQFQGLTLSMFLIIYIIAVILILKRYAKKNNQ